MDPEVETFTFAPDGDIPNNALPLLLYRHALPPGLQNPAACQALFRENDWVGNWVDGVFDYWHFHVTGHEVLGCVAGEAEIGFGGDHGAKVTFRAGDVVAIPAGVGHKRLGEKRGGFTVVGGYPPGQSGAISRPGDYSLSEAQARIATLALPHRDPVGGPEGPLIEEWGVR
jgi:uncharacterized protein YjlB